MGLKQIVLAKDSTVFFKDKVSISKPYMDKIENKVQPTKNPQRMGAAFDYAFRFGLDDNLNSCIVKKRDTIVAQSALNFLKKRLPEDYNFFKQIFDESLISINWSDEAKKSAISCLNLAELDVIFRTKNIFEIKDISDQEISELIDLYNLINFETFDEFGEIYLNPVFGYGSKKVGGADADIIADDLLVEIKTVKSPKFSMADLKQLIGYSVLCNNFGITGKDNIQISKSITRIGVYYSRVGYLFTANLSDCISESDQIKVLDWLLNHEFSRP